MEKCVRSFSLAEKYKRRRYSFQFLFLNFLIEWCSSQNQETFFGFFFLVPISMSAFLAVVLWDMVLCRGLSLCLGFVLLVSFCFILGLGVQFCSGSCWPFLAQFCSLSSSRLTCLWEYTLSYSAWLIVEGKRKKKACSA